MVLLRQLVVKRYERTLVGIPILGRQAKALTSDVCRSKLRATVSIRLPDFVWAINIHHRRSSTGPGSGQRGCFSRGQGERSGP